MRKLTTVLLFVLFTGLGVSALAQDKILNKPRVCDNPGISFQSGEVLSRRGTGNRVWNVFSNSAENVAYTDQNCTTPAGVNFPFLKAFYVLKEYENAVKVVVDSYVKDGIWELMPGYADSVYYFPKNKMLLWDNPVISDSLLIDECIVKLPQKALIIKNLKNLQSQHIYTNPDGVNKGTYISDYQQRNVEVLYLYQYDEKNDAYLCGADPQIPSIRYVSSSIRGWVSAASLSKWHSNLSIEPNWVTSSDRLGSTQYSRVYTRLSDGRSFGSNKAHRPANQMDLIFNEEDYRQEILNDPLHRLPGDMLRFQLLTKAVDLSNAYPRVGVVGKKIDLDCNCDYDPVTVAEYTREVSAVIEKRQRNNIIFVVDGTQSMDQALEGVANALTKTMQRIQDENEAELKAGGDPINYFFGAVVFRDTDDSNPIELTNNGQLTDNRARVVSDLRNIFSHGANTSTVPESVFLGIKTAVNQFNPDPDNRNYLFLLGDAGNNFAHEQTNFNTPEVAKWLSDRNIDFFSVQVRHKSNSAYDEFCQQTSEILEKNILNRNKKFRQKYENENNQGNSCVRCNLEKLLGEVYGAIPQATTVTKDKNSRKVTGKALIDNNIESVAYNIFSGSMAMGANVCIPQSDSPEDIINENELSTLLDYFLNNINNTSKSFGRSNSSTDDYVKRIIADLFQSRSMTMEKLAAVFGNGTQLYQEGYTAYKPQWLTQTADADSFDGALWQYVSFVNHASTSELIANIDRLFVPSFNSVGQLRNKIFEVMRSLIVNRYRYLSAAEFNDTEICSVLSLLTGLPADRTNFDWCSVVMRDLNNPNKVPDEAVLEMALNFIVFKGHLQSIQRESSVFDQRFFNTYQRYLLLYLRERNVVISAPKRQDFYQALVSFFEKGYDSYYENPTFKNADINNKKNMNNKYYWIQASLYPVTCHSNLILEQAAPFKVNN